MSELDQNGFIATKGGPSICIGPLALRGVGAELGALSMNELKAMLGPEQTKLLRELFGSGAKGAEEALQNLTRPMGLSNDAISAYREIANRAIAAYEQSGNAAGAALQRARLEILDRLAK